MSEQGSRYYSPRKDSGIGTYVNHKRMAVLAAVAAVTPTVLVAAPASAEEARPAARSPHGPTRNPLFDTHTRADAPAADPRRQMTSVVREVPDTFEAGGDWGEFTLVIGNLTDHDLSDYDVNLAVDTIHPAPRLVMEHMRVQLRVDGAWVDAPLEQPDRDGNVDAALPLDRVVLPPADTAFQVRIRFTSDAPLTFFMLGPTPDTRHAAQPRPRRQLGRVRNRTVPRAGSGSRPRAHTRSDPAHPDPLSEPFIVVQRGARSSTHRHHAAHTRPRPPPDRNRTRGPIGA